jgi:AcrR family transcriptional regulator
MPKQTFFNLSDEKRESILGAAVAEFAEKGYKAASVSAIVAAAKIAKGSFYQYFEDKDDLYAYIFTNMIGVQKFGAFEAEKHRLEDLNLTEFLRVVFMRQLETFKSSPELIRISFDFTTLAGEPVHARLMEQYRPAVEGYFLPYIEYEIAQGELDPAINKNMLNFMLVSVGQYLLSRYQELGAGVVTPGFIDKLADDLEYILTNGIYLKHVPGR